MCENEKIVSKIIRVISEIHQNCKKSSQQNEIYNSTSLNFAMFLVNCVILPVIDIKEQILL